VPSRADHVEQAKRNKAFMEWVLANPAQPQEWAVAALFYVCVHLGRAVVEQLGAGPVTSHRGFETTLQRLKPPADVYDAYRALKDVSEQARYDCHRYFEADVRKLEADHLQILLRWSQRHLGLAKSPLDD
jgi:hypothetical protein